MYSTRNMGKFFVMIAYYTDSARLQDLFYKVCNDSHEIDTLLKENRR